MAALVADAPFIDDKAASHIYSKLALSVGYRLTVVEQDGSFANYAVGAKGEPYYTDTDVAVHPETLGYYSSKHYPMAPPSPMPCELRGNQTFSYDDPDDRTNILNAIHKTRNPTT